MLVGEGEKGKEKIFNPNPVTIFQVKLKVQGVKPSQLLISNYRCVSATPHSSKERGAL